MQGRHTRRHRGGEHWTGFKYTRNESRADWVDALSPYAATIASILTKIDWAGFRYKGPLQIETDAAYVDRDEWSGAPPQKVIRNTHCRSLAPVDYQVFGGGACELWGLAVPEVPIRRYVDFTGDLDVTVNPPPFIIHDPALTAALEQDELDIDLTMADPVLLDERGYTPYGEALTRWLYDEVVRQAREISPYFNRQGFVVPDYREDSETAVSDLQTTVGNLLVCRSPMLEREMIKIQITAKVEEEMNHIMEFIFTPKGRFSGLRKNGFRVNGISLQQPKLLLQDQVKGLTGRGTGILNILAEHPEMERVENYPGFYKFDNHCARLLYLADLQKAVEGKIIKGSSKPADFMSEHDVLALLEEIYAAGGDKLCAKHFGGDYMGKLMAAFEAMEYVGKGALTTKLDSRSKVILNRAKAQSRAVGGHRKTRRRRYR